MTDDNDRFWWLGYATLIPATLVVLWVTLQAFWWLADRSGC